MYQKNKIVIWLCWLIFVLSSCTHLEPKFVLEGIERVGPSGQGFQNPIWSPDGTKIAVTTQTVVQDWTSEIFVLDVLTGKKKSIMYTNNGNVMAISWSPDGNQILLASQNGGDWPEGIWTLDSDGKSSAQFLAEGYDGDWSPDGKRMAVFSHSEKGAHQDVMLSILSLKTGDREEVYMRYTCRWLLQVIIGGLLISSCVTNSSLPLPTDQLTASTTHLETPSVSRTKPEATQTNVPTPSLIPTLTPPVTLEPEKAADEIKRLISEKPDCQAPCLWGIVPEQTTQGEAFNFFTGLGFPMTPGASNGVYSSTPGFDNLWVKIKLYVQDQVVRGVWARLDLSNYDGPVKPRPWAGFSPDTVLLQYRKPSRVEFALYHPTEPGDATGKVWYEMVIWFDEKKVIADYFDGETRAGSVVRVCPLTDRFGSVDIRIGENPNAPLPKKVLLENATSLTIDQFYELMIQKDGPKCLDLKLEAFPEK